MLSLLERFWEELLLIIRMRFKSLEIHLYYLVYFQTGYHLGECLMRN